MIKRRFTLVAAIVGLFGPIVSLAASPLFAASVPRLYFAQPAVTIHAGTDVSLPLHINPNGASLDTVDVVVSFPAAQLTYVGFDNSASAFASVVPSAPIAANGKVEFSVAQPGGVSADALVGNLIFLARNAAGSAQVSLGGSTAADAGVAVGVTVGNATLNFTAGSNAGGTAVTISDISVSNIIQSGATVRWTTNVPATSTVSYGSGGTYGFSADTAGLTTAHVVQLNTVFGGGTTVHYSPSSIGADGNGVVAADHTFKTLGYTVEVTVLSGGSRILAGVDVVLGGTQSAKTGSSGVAVISNVQPGVRKLKVNGGRTQLISVQAVTGTAALKPQTFTVTAKDTPLLWYIIGLAALLMIAVTAWVRYRRRKIIKVKAEEEQKHARLEEALARKKAEKAKK